MNRDYKPSLALLARFLREDCTSEERSMVEKWLHADEENRQYLQNLEQEWVYLHEKPLSLDETTRQRVWERVQQNTTPVTAKVRFLTPRRLWLNAVAVAVMALLIGGLAVYFIQQNSFRIIMEGQLTSVSTNLGQKSELLLPDGTRVWLNAGTKLSYTQGFNQNNRIVNLDGEAFFDVTKNEDLPFIVQTSNLDVVVKGTAFDVSSYSDDGFIEVSLLRGKVEVHSKEGTLISELSPKDLIRYDKSKNNYALIRGNDAEQYSTWVAEELIFDNEPFDVVVKKLERWYGVNIHWENTTSAKRYTFKVKTESLREILHLLNVITPIDYTITGKEVKVRPR